VRQHYAAISIGAALGSSILLYNYFVSSNKPTLDPSAFTAFTLTRRVPVSHNTDIFRFDLPRPMPTDLPIISFVRVKDDSMQVARPYTPISPTSERRFIDLMVKRYENGQVSKWLHGLKVDDKVEIKGPARTFDYKENMKKNVGMVSQETSDDWNVYVMRVSENEKLIGRFMFVVRDSRLLVDRELLQCNSSKSIIHFLWRAVLAKIILF